MLRRQVGRGWLLEACRHGNRPVLRESPLYANILVRDVARARRFYEDVLEMEPLQTAASEVVYRSGTTRFAISRADDAGETAHTVGCFIVDDVERVVSGLRARGVRFEDYDLPGLVTVDGIAAFASDGSPSPTGWPGSVTRMGISCRSFRRARRRLRRKHSYRQ